MFKNEFNELRAGWQILLFLLVLSAAIGAFVFVLIQLERTDAFSMSVASLAGTLLATFAATRFINRKPFVSVGLAVNRHAMREFGIGCLAGWLMMTAIFGIEYVQGYVKIVAADVSFAQGVEMFLVSLLFFGVAAMFEEILFRGYLFQTLMRGIKFIPSVLITGLVFGLAHAANPNANLFGVVNTILVSVLFCFAYWRTRALWLPFGIHFAWNFAQTTLYGYPTSGKHFTAYELTTLTQFGPEWITGGAYGPEGGALATVMILLCGVYVYFSRSLQAFTGIAVLERPDEHLGFFERRKAA